EEEEQPKGKGGKKTSKPKKKPSPKEEKEEDKMDDAELEWAHRERAHELRALAKELGGRIRSLRFFQCVRAFQGDANLRTTCPQCKRSNLLPNEVSILSSCGHVGCNACVTAAAANEACVQQASGECRVPASPLFVVPADTLGHDKKADADGRHWGQKLEDITELIRSLPSDERVLIFVQFPDLTKKVAEALTASKLTFTEIKGTALHQAKVLQDFQDPSSKVRILLLNLGDESASGGNLTVANHAVFISPLLAKNQFEYTQAETQAIGRIRRFGQMKTANIYRFVTRSTIDQEIYTNRGQSLGDLSKRVQISRTIALKDNEDLSGVHTSGIEMDTSE
ncbi:10661_t:CDS:2, partial [Acaulospora colombiana]